MKKAPLKWHGGKQYLAPWIIEHRPDDYTHYAEAYFGGGAVLLHHDPAGKSEAVNDINLNLTNFWRCLKDERAFEDMQRRLEVTPFSQVEFQEAGHALETQSVQVQEEMRAGTPCVKAAVDFFIRVRQSRQGLRKDFATLSRNRTRGGRNEQANSWWGAIDGLREVHTRLCGVVIFCSDALDFIAANDSTSTWFYLDPTYRQEDRVATDAYGEYEMTEEQHVALLDTLAGIDGMFSLSSYPNEVYDSYAQELGWRWVDRQIDNKASSSKSKPKKIERLYMNY